MNRKLFAAIAALLLLTAVTPASADISVWLGRLSGEELLISGTAAYGGAIGFSFARYVGFEVVIDYIPDSELPFDLEELEELTGIDARVDLLSLSGNLLLQYPIQDQVTPYFTIGYGGMGARVTADLPNKPEAFGGTTVLNWGIGAKLRVAPFLSIRGDMRWYRLEISGKDLGDLIETIENPTLSRLAIGASFNF